MPQRSSSPKVPFLRRALHKPRVWLATLLVTGMGAAQALPVLTFDTDAATSEAVLAAYGFTASWAPGPGDANATVSGGQLTLTGGGSRKLYFGAFSGDLVIEFDVAHTASTAAGSANVGLTVGTTNFVFHPGYPTGAFRVDGLTGNLDMGFTPSLTVLSHYRATIDAETGGVQITITDGANPLHVYQSTQYLVAGYVGGTTQFGLQVASAGAGVFDNLRVTMDPVSTVPEPGTAALALAGLALTALLAGGPRRRRA